MRWLVCDSLYHPEQFFCSHLDSFSTYLREAGETVERIVTWNAPGWHDKTPGEVVDVAFVLDQYQRGPRLEARKLIAQVAAVCNPMPWEVRKPDGSPSYDLVISSILAMVEQARAAGCRAEYMPLAFDTRALVCKMGVKRERKAIFCGTVGPNHRRRAELLNELRDIVEVVPPTFGRDYFRLLASAKVVLNIHAEWAQGAANNMRIFEAGGMGCHVVSDGNPGDITRHPWWSYWDGEYVEELRQMIRVLLDCDCEPWRDRHWVQHYEDMGHMMAEHTYVQRIPQLIEWAGSLR